MSFAVLSHGLCAIRVEAQLAQNCLLSNAVKLGPGLGAVLRPASKCALRLQEHFMLTQSDFILKHRFSSEEPGVVYASKHPTDRGERYVLLRTSDTYPPGGVPEQTPPPGLDAKRQWYLYEKIREFCSDDGADATCPRPTVPRPRSNDDDDDDDDEPEEKVPRT